MSRHTAPLPITPRAPSGGDSDAPAVELACVLRHMMGASALLRRRLEATPVNDRAQLVAQLAALEARIDAALRVARALRADAP